MGWLSMPLSSMFPHTGPKAYLDAQFTYDNRDADGKGKETPGRLDDWIEVGVFADGGTGKERDQRVLYLKRHHITQANPELTVTVDALPIEAGFDPYNKLIDRVSSDNRKKVTLR